MAIFIRYRWLKASELMLFFFNFMTAIEREQSDVCIVFAKREQSRLKVKAGFYERFYSYFDTQTVVKSIKTFVEERALTIAAHEQYS